MEKSIAAAETKAERNTAELERRLNARLKGIDERQNRQRGGRLQIWVGVAAIMLSGITWSWTNLQSSMNAVVKPVQVRLDGLEKSDGKSEARAESHIHELEEQIREMSRSVARVGLMEQMLMADMTLDHGAGRGDGLAAARIEAVQQRQTELWQLVETARMEINAMSRKVSALNERQKP